MPVARIIEIVSPGDLRKKRFLGAFPKITSIHGNEALGIEDDLVVKGEALDLQGLDVSKYGCKTLLQFAGFVQDFLCVSGIDVVAILQTHEISQYGFDFN